MTCLSASKGPRKVPAQISFFEFLENRQVISGRRGHFYVQFIIPSICFFVEKKFFVCKIIDFPRTRGQALPKIRNKNTNFPTNFHYWECHNTRNSWELLVAPTEKKINFVTRDILKNRIFGFLEEECVFKHKLWFWAFASLRRKIFLLVKSLIFPGPGVRRGLKSEINVPIFWPIFTTNGVTTLEIYRNYLWQPLGKK